MSQVLLLGISGLDADLLRVYGPSLPNLRRLMLESPFLDLNSTIPPEPVPAWVSVYTGLNPANHGLLASMDCLERAIPGVESFQEELFWEKAARAGKRVCVLNPLLTTPQGVEGLMQVPSTPCPIAGEGELTRPLAETFPALLDEPLIPPASQLTTFCNLLRDRTEKQVTTGLELFAREAWDLFYLQLDALDHVQHFLWRYSDPGDPMYPGKNEHANRILEFYQLFDTIVGRFRAAISDSECVLGIISSHGHERRCVYRLHINEWLREQQFLTPLGQTGQKYTGSAQPTRLQEIYTWLAQHLPWSKGSSSKRHSIDPRHSIAQMVELASATSSFGGITINRELLERPQPPYAADHP
jgi:predicted AlkP superfamily phosphohydrolase/phosphomutase